MPGLYSYGAAGTLDGTEEIPVKKAGVNAVTTASAITLSLSTATSTGLSTATSSITSLSTSTSTGLSTAVSTGASLSTAVAGKQATLVSATNIKTINSNSLLGAGDLVVSAAPGGSTTEIQFNDAGALAGDPALTWDKTNNVLAIAQGTLTTSQPQTHTVTWNDGAVTFIANLTTITNTASAAGSLFHDYRIGAQSYAAIQKNGTYRGYSTGAGQYVGWTPTDIGGHAAWGYLRDTETTPRAAVGVAGFYAGSTEGFKFTNTSADARATVDTALARIAAGIVGIRTDVGGNGASLSFIEQTAPSAPSANGVYIYAQDNGAGKTQLMALFASGAAQQIAIEP